MAIVLLWFNFIGNGFLFLVFLGMPHEEMRGVFHLAVALVMLVLILMEPDDDDV